MKEIKENLKLILWTSLIAFTLILAFSCKKQTQSFGVFEGYWQINRTSCSAHKKALNIKLVKTYGKFSKKINQYEVVSGQEVFSCYSSDASAYYFSGFTFDSSREAPETGFGADDKDLDFEVIDSKTLVVTYKGSPQWKVTLKKM